MSKLKDLLNEISWRNFHRGWLWLVLAILTFWAIDHLTWAGFSGYTIRKLGSLATAAACIWGGYRVTRDVLKIDPSQHEDAPIAYAILHLSRALLVAGLTIAVCLAP